MVAAVIVRDGKYLVCQRPLHKRHGGLWEFPGGKIEDGESLLEAAQRELAEELQVEVLAVGDVYYRRRDPGSCFVIEFVETVVGGEPQPVEHTAVCWASAGDLADMSLAPTDQEFAEQLLLGPQEALGTGKALENSYCSGLRRSAIRDATRRTGFGDDSQV